MNKKALLLACQFAVICLIGCEPDEDKQYTTCSLEISELGVSGIQIGDNLTTVQKNFSVERIEILKEDIPKSFYKVRFCHEEILTFDLDEREKVVALQSASKLITYRNNIVIDTTLKELLDLYPDGKLYWEFSDGKEYFFRPSHNDLTFSLGFSNIDDECLEAAGNCSNNELQIKVQRVFTY